MISKTRTCRVVAGGAVLGIAAVVGLAGATATADPVLPAPPAPVPAPVTAPQPVTVAPALAGTAPAASAVPPAAGIPAAGTQPVAATPAVPAAPALVPATSGTLREYLEGQGVKLEAQDPRTFRALQITLPMPTGWTRVPDPNVPDAYAVIADRAGGDGLYTSNAQVVIYKLVGEFDPREAITHGFIDSQKLTGWQSTAASLAEFGGFPSSVIEGSYRDGDMALNTSRRYVIATGGPDKYLVSLAVTTSVNQVVATGDATDAIINGFRVTDPAAVPVAQGPAAVPAPAPLGMPVQPAPALPTS